ncbi:efflux RND transporter periplasmic adaptor subunit [Paenibacillus radicis (ex Xue et al. 2023)]|uniref:Efflux RND transporter periplasmic adaptor subunit n=1 Tax=Paenibacillus radicis (ex Xue et al. 2023) TaxID=2972489 RepID=A0ABT1YSE6_9BACL|nr:efflux RND transporter periplasmic adaptor subunit [Paenibacillus radicis (ex Xue et al. 2023)]MCR8634905.1 efflux RND transporter periplasmic adaptor subunit [Paenibacillus radicis (ex Xue et al. 2023)]
MYSKWWMGNLLTHRRAARPVLIACMAALLAVSSGCSLLPKEDEEETLPAIAPPKLSKKPEYVVKTETLETKVRGSGRMMATKEEDLYFTDEANRRIKAMNVKNGDKVEQGQIIAELDVTEQESKLKQQRLQTRKDELAMIESMRKADEMSAEALEQAKIDFELRREELVKLETTIANAKLAAPFAGTVVTIYMKKGDSAQAYDVVATIADLSQLTVVATLNTEDLKKVSVGMEAVVDINGAGQHKGKVTQLPIPKVDNGNGNGNNNGGYIQGNNGGNGQPKPIDTIDNYLVVQLDALPQGLNRGTPLSVSIITQRKEKAITIPLAALRSYSGRNYVQVVDEQGNKKEVDVEIGQQTATDVEIIKGLTSGQKVVGR